ncbi:MAG: FecR family protein [Pedobacter sp.]|nr:MAG: FecR family protein [Pedobacter sp.]
MLKMEHKKLNDLLSKYKSATLSEAEKLELDNWYLQEAEAYKNKLSEDDVQEISKDIASNLPLKRQPVPLRQIWVRIGIAASICLISYLSVSEFYHNKEINQNILKASTILPGTNGATLTLGNGTKVILDQQKMGLVATDSGTLIKKNANGEIVYDTQSENSTPVLNTISTAVGQQYQVVLPDGTHVWLNASSSLKYPTFFKMGSREVELVGEAYFEVSHNPSAPFIVKSANQDVRVLGTHFNISAYSDDAIVRTTLFEGKVQVAKTDRSSLLTLKPGEETVLESNQLTTKQANLLETIAWKEGYFRFYGKDIKSIMKMLSRWYNIEVEYIGPVTNEHYYGKISRFKSINEVLKMLEKAQGVHFKIEGRRVAVTK